MNADERRSEAGFKDARLTEKVIGLFYDVYNELGYGFLESVYRISMCMAMRQAGLNVYWEYPTPVYFRGEVVGEFKADILVNEVLLLELKSARAIDPAHEAQLLNYLRATSIEVGLLLNFGPKPQFKRLVFSNARKKICVDPRSSAAESPDRSA